MSPYRSDIAALNHIAAILIDARRLYARVAQVTDDAQTLAKLERTLGERGQLLSEIQNRVAELGGAPQMEGSLLGAAHKAYFNVKALFNRDQRGALGELERGERYLRDEIRKAMRRDELDAETRAFLGIVLDRIVSGEMRLEAAREMAEQRHEERESEPMHLPHLATHTRAPAPPHL